MIKHIVMWKLKEVAEGKSKLENANTIKMKLENLQQKIKEAKLIEVGININDSKQAYDVVLYSEFENLEDLNLYQNHPEHLKVGEFINKVKEDRIVADYEVLK
ncbi:Dabb family protein [Clostridium tepidum]|uniref:Stress responsive protein n=1 Tax=Clostridium tepidum TaxID=1962263 RepID=A0A1S9IFT9_9CLOT|nr:Dabb family protein [Clostridium tepidum]MCR1934008.1 Dabb family protein [Clostridium tepidum]MDU6877803.1 Dabb family protein [Clostridium botulinum]OOO63335.1 stress responsive protein [Clostridium tepidum]OOO69176.1 stress responsive protein [Clostridium tepidum]